MDQLHTEQHNNNSYPATPTTRTLSPRDIHCCRSNFFQYFQRRGTRREVINIVWALWIGGGGGVKNLPGDFRDSLNIQWDTTRSLSRSVEARISNGRSSLSLASLKTKRKIHKSLPSILELYMLPGGAVILKEIRAR